MRNYKYSPATNGNIKERKINLLLNQVVSIALAISLIFCALAYITARTFDMADVKGTSMFPTINIEGSGDVAYFTYLKKANRGDVIIVDYRSTGLKFDAIKRLIAKGGDTICYYDGHLLLNGQVLEEEYLQKDYETLKAHPEYLKGYSSADDWLNGGYTVSKNNFENWCKSLLEDGEYTIYNTKFFKNYATDYANSIKYYADMGEGGTYVLNVPEGFVYFLGDNRGGSTDCSAIGPIEEKYIKAKVDFIAESNATIFAIFMKEISHLFG